MKKNNTPPIIIEEEDLILDFEPVAINSLDEMSVLIDNMIKWFSFLYPTEDEQEDKWKQIMKTEEEKPVPEKINTLVLKIFNNELLLIEQQTNEKLKTK